MPLSPISVETLFQVFARRWSHKWARTFEDPKARVLWLTDLRSFGIDDKFLEAGLHRSAKLEWPPSPAEFACLCKPSHAEAGLPRVNDAYRAAVHRRWSLHSVVYETAKRVGLWELTNRSEASSRPDFEREFATVCAEYMAGARFEAPKVERITQQPKLWQAATPAEARAKCDQLRKLLGPMPAPIKPDASPEPINDEQFAARLDADQQAINEAAARYQGMGS